MFLFLEWFFSKTWFPTTWIILLNPFLVCFRLSFCFPDFQQFCIIIPVVGKNCSLLVALFQIFKIFEWEIWIIYFLDFCDFADFCNAVNVVGCLNHKGLLLTSIVKQSNSQCTGMDYFVTSFLVMTVWHIPRNDIVFDCP